MEEKSTFTGNLFDSFVRSIILCGSYLIMYFLFDHGTLPWWGTLISAAGILLLALTLLNVWWEEGKGGFWPAFFASVLLAYPIYLLGGYLCGLVGYETGWLWAGGIGIVALVIAVSLLFISFVLLKELFRAKNLGAVLGTLLALALGYAIFIFFS